MAFLGKHERSIDAGMPKLEFLITAHVINVGPVSGFGTSWPLWILPVLPHNYKCTSANPWQTLSLSPARSECNL